MKKFLILLISIFIFMNSSIFASSEYIEFLSGEQDDGAIYLDSYEDYMNAIGDVNEQDYYKEEYNNMIAEAMTYFNSYNRSDVVKAKVLSIENTKEYYSYDNYGSYKIKYQPIKVQILEYFIFNL